MAAFYSSSGRFYRCFDRNVRTGIISGFAGAVGAIGIGFTYTALGRWSLEVSSR